MPKDKLLKLINNATSPRLSSCKIMHKDSKKHNVRFKKNSDNKERILLCKVKKSWKQYTEHVDINLVSNTKSFKPLPPFINGPVSPCTSPYAFCGTVLRKNIFLQNNRNSTLSDYSGKFHLKEYVHIIDLLEIVDFTLVCIIVTYSW